MDCISALFYLIYRREIGTTIETIEITIEIPYAILNYFSLLYVEQLNKKMGAILIFYRFF